MNTIIKNFNNLNKQYDGLGYVLVAFATFTTYALVKLFITL